MKVLDSTGALKVTGTVGGSGTANRVAVWSAATALSSDSAFTFDLTTKALVINGVIIATSSVTLAEANDFVLGTTTGTKIGTATTQKLGFYNATPIVQPANTTDLRTALINLGLLASGGATPLNLNGGTLTAFGVTFDDAAAIRTLTAGTTNGVKIGAGTTDKLGFYGVTPVARPSAFTQTYSTTSKTVANPLAASVATTAATNVTPFGYSTAAQADAIRAAVNNLITDVANIKNNLNSVIDDLQLEGALG